MTGVEKCHGQVLMKWNLQCGVAFTPPHPLSPLRPFSITRHTYTLSCTCTLSCTLSWTAIKCC